MTVRVFLVDDHEVVRRGMRELIEAEDDLTVVGEASCTAEALELLPPTEPDVAVLDEYMPERGDGIELCRALRALDESLVTLMLSGLEDDETLLGAILAGASGFALKRLRGDEIVDKIRRVAAGENLFDPALTKRLLRRAATTDLSPTTNAPRLTQQEQRILDLIAEGLTNRQIGERLYLSEKTVKNYVSNLLSKLGMKRRTEAAVYAVRRLNRTT